MKKITFTLFLTVAAYALSCSGSSTASTNSCKYPSDGCAVGPGDQSDCTNGGGTFYAGDACPTENRLTGYCTLTLEGQSGKFYYYSPTFNASSAQSNCTLLGGTWNSAFTQLHGQWTLPLSQLSTFSD